ncbi:MAG TPA: peroxiredoxin family protein [Chthonomonadales bacterium]|nr:peroxiredoxin family protein [Chthonomonadales bacterium]
MLYRAGMRTEALAEFKKLQAISGSIDMNAPIFHRLSDIAVKLGLSADWRVPRRPESDLGPRPRLSSLGPFRWRPSKAPYFSLTDASGNTVSLADYTTAGKPLLLAFYLGAGCSACMDQLNKLAANCKAFQQAGVSIAAIGPQGAGDLAATSMRSASGLGLPFPLLAGTGLKVFQEYRAYDDFEKMPLHGLFLIDGKGYIRWQDVSYQPFTDMAFLLAESRRLLGEPAVEVASK